MDIATLNKLRYWIQRIVVPCVVIVGVLGNLVTVIILTRKRMRCSTNIYLTALAIADLIYLLFVFILSLEHYPNIHYFRYELYWRLYGLSHWFADASSYTSIWLTVSFTIERYIAVCHPIRGKVLCTESRAKRVITMVTILCFITTVTTSFEYQLTSEAKMMFSNSTNNSIPESNMLLNVTNANTYVVDNDNNSSINCSQLDNSTSVCHDVIYLLVKYSELGNNVIYRAVFYWFTSVVFVVVPLILLATFNCFLVVAVHTSHKQRGKMTNNQSDAILNQENRITIILIGVVLLFLLCQTPMAGLLLYTSIAETCAANSGKENVLRALGNLFNLLVSVNAACNFLLYCALSDKYRRTFRAFFFNRGTIRTNTMRLNSRCETAAETSNNRLKRHISEYTPRSSQTQNNVRAKSMICRRQLPK